MMWSQTVADPQDGTTICCPVLYLVGYFGWEAREKGKKAGWSPRSFTQRRKCTMLTTDSEMPFLASAEYKTNREHRKIQEIDWIFRLPPVWRSFSPPPISCTRKISAVERLESVECAEYSTSSCRSFTGSGNPKIRGSYRTKAWIIVFLCSSRHLSLFDLFSPVSKSIKLMKTCSSFPYFTY